jgi:hypothetical protein
MNQRYEKIPAARIWRSGLILGFVGLLCSLSFQTKAAPDAFTLAGGDIVSADGTIDCEDAGSFNAAPSSSTCTRDFEVTGSASYSSSAGYGVLKAMALAAAGNAAAPNQGGTAAGEAEFRDALTASLGTCSTSCLFSGTLVVTASLDGVASALNPNSSASGQLTLSLIDASNPGLLRDQEGATIQTQYPGGRGVTSSTGGICGTQTGDPVSGLAATGSCLVTAKLAYTAGDKVFLSGILQTLASTSPSQDPTTGAISGGLAQANFSDTAMISSIGLYDSSGNLMNDVVFTNASGTSYPAPVPLPPALWLLGSGLLGLIGVARRVAT